MSLATEMFANLLITWENTLSIAAIMWCLERLLPKEHVSIESQLRSLKFWAVAGVGTASALTLYNLVGKYLQPQPLVIIPMNAWFGSPWVHWLMYLIAPLSGMIIFDFFGYWLHRAQHKWFWRLHAVHHSIEELSGINSYFHWTEQFFRIAFISLPAAYLIGIDAIQTVFIIELLFRLQDYYLHSPSTIHFGPVVRRVIADNRFHRIHHSREKHHFDKNFGAGTSIWDQLFGTAYFPTKNEWPLVGVAGQPEAKTICEYVFGAFRRQQGVARPGGEEKSSPPTRVTA